MKPACRTRELSAEQKITRDYWRKQVPPVCGDVFKSFCSRVLFLPGTREQKLSKRRHTRGTCLRQWSRVNFCSAENSRVRQA